MRIQAFSLISIKKRIKRVLKIADLKQKHRRGKTDFFTMQVASINRKPVPLCKSHHISLHGNKLTEIEITAFKKRC
jgi:hypothetical protein